MLSKQVLTERPHACHFTISWPYGTQSNAFDKSIAMVTNCFCYPRPHAKASLIIEWRADYYGPDDRPIYTVFYIQCCNTFWLQNHNKSYWRHIFNTYTYGCNTLVLKYEMALPLCMKTLRNTLLLREAISEDVQYPKRKPLTRWHRVTHICLSKLTIIGLDNGLSPGRHQAIFWTNAGILLVGPLRTNFNLFFNRHLYIFIEENPFKNMV